jgi:hypothetical protein
MEHQDKSKTIVCNAALLKSGEELIKSWHDPYDQEV